MAEVADESKVQCLERKIAVARREINNLRSEINSLKKMFVQKFKDVKKLVEKGKQESTTDCKQDSCKVHDSGKKLQRQNTQQHETVHSEMKPIGFVDSCFKEKNGIPRQPSVCSSAKANLCINVEGFTNPEHSLEGLEEFSHVWIIFLFHKNTNKAIKAKVAPPRLDGAKVGVFASRSPHRPNPIGLTLAKLDGIIGNTLLLSGIDLLDGTPVLDVKPYVPDYDKPLSIDGKGKLELSGSDVTLCQDMDISKGQETVHMDHNSGTQNQNQENLGLRPASPSIAEWIRNPPIKELNVKFSDEAAAQIGCFHGNMLLRELCYCSKWDGKVDNLSSQRCPGAEKPEELSSRRSARKKMNDSGTIRQSILCSVEELTVVSLMNSNQSAETHYSNALDEELHSREGFTVPSRERCPLVCKNDSGSLNEKLHVASASLSHCEVQRSFDTCIYQLKMLSSPEEAKKAISDILKADPRSIYRRNHCQDKLYRFSIDTMNVTCKFDDSTVEVLRVEPVYLRKLNGNSKD